MSVYVFFQHGLGDKILTWEILGRIADILGILGFFISGVTLFTSFRIKKEVSNQLYKRTFEEWRSNALKKFSATSSVFIQNSERLENIYPPLKECYSLIVNITQKYQFMSRKTKKSLGNCQKHMEEIFQKYSPNNSYKLSSNEILELGKSFREVADCLEGETVL